LLRTTLSVCAPATVLPTRLLLQLSGGDPASLLVHAALKPLAKLLTATQLVAADQADFSAELTFMDRPAPYQGLAVLFRELVK